MAFLEREMKIVLRLADEEPSKPTRGDSHHGSTEEKGAGPGKKNKQHRKSDSNHADTGNTNSKFRDCAFHEKGKHKTAVCENFKKLDMNEKYEVLKKVHACFRCFGNHHHTLMCRDIHDSTSTDESSNDTSSSSSNDKTEESSAESNVAVSDNSFSWFPVYENISIYGAKKYATIFCDNGSNVTYITHKAAKIFKAKKLKPHSLEVKTTGGGKTTYNTCKYEVKITTSAGKVTPIIAFGMETITGNLATLDEITATYLFPDWDPDSPLRKGNEVDILLGADYFGLHPKKELYSDGDNLSIMRGELGICVVGKYNKKLIGDSVFVHRLLTEGTNFSQPAILESHHNIVTHFETSEHVCDASRSNIPLNSIQENLCTVEDVKTDSHLSYQKPCRDGKSYRRLLNGLTTCIFLLLAVFLIVNIYKVMSSHMQTKNHCIMDFYPEHIRCLTENTYLNEITNLLNEQPIGIRPGLNCPIHSLTPNCLLIGRCTAKNPGGWLPETGNLISRFEIVQSVVKEFWHNWRELYAPSLVWDQKWHTSTRNLEVGDVVLLSESNSLKGEYRLGRVTEVFPSSDGLVRKVNLAYKNFKIGEKVYEYAAVPDTIVSRSVRKLSLIVPVTEDDHCK